jgi:integrase
MAKRRANGEGSVHQRTDGRWQASMSLPNGMRKHFLGKTWEEAHAKLVAAKAALAEGRPPALEKQTVRQFLTQWLEATAPSRKPRTNIRYRELITIHVVPEVGGIQLSKVTPMDVQGIYATMLKKHLSPTTVRQVHAILHKAFKQAVGWNLMFRNPTDYAERPRIEYKETTVLSSEQVKAFLTAAKGTRFEALFLLAVTTGMREGELLACDGPTWNWMVDSFA